MFESIPPQHTVNIYLFYSFMEVYLTKLAYIYSVQCDVLIYIELIDTTILMIFLHGDNT